MHRSSSQDAEHSGGAHVVHGSLSLARETKASPWRTGCCTCWEDTRKSLGQSGGGECGRGDRRVVIRAEARA